MLDPDLMESLEVACADALGGDPPGPAVALRLERVVKEVLGRAGLGAAKVRATSDRKATRVEILLPGPGARVRSVVLSVGPG